MEAAGSNIPQVRTIDKLVREMWTAYDVQPSAVATDAEWCRRLYLDLIGRIPSVNELEAFTSDKNKNKRRDLVDRLLNDDSYTEEYSRNWTTIWTNLLIGRTGGTETTQ